LKPDAIGQAKVILTRVVSKSHSGPIPSADELEHLERVIPGAADRVFTMAEKEQNHRHSTTDTLIVKEFALRTKGQNLGIVFATLLLLTVGFIAYLGDTKSAAILGGATIVAGVSIFVTGRWIDSSGSSNEEPVSEKPQPRNNNQKNLPKNNKAKRR
jgi:uncharacterized membrane protein